jgi:pyruvate ferredoxin oxidoreductase beta subunit
MTQEKIFEPLTRGFAACSGCMMPGMARAVLSGKPDDTDIVVVVASGCFVVATDIYPRTAWSGVSMLHPNFETAASAASALCASYKVQKRKHHLPNGNTGRKFRVVVLAGDGATFDIGLGPYSGMLERGEPIIYVCYDNGAYSNTGEQSSGSTPSHAITATTPGGVLRSEKAGGKDLVSITLSHPAVAYAARTTFSTMLPNDIKEKSAAAFAHDTGPVLLHVITPCPRGWGFKPSDAYSVSDLAILTGECPLYHAEKVGRDHIMHLDYLPERYLGGILHPDVHPITELLETQDRFGDLLKRLDWLADYQEEIDHRWLGRHGLIAKCEPYGS